MDGENYVSKISKSLFFQKKNLQSLPTSRKFPKASQSLGGGFNPFEKYDRQNGFIFPKFRGENKKYLSCHHPDHHFLPGKIPKKNPPLLTSPATGATLFEGEVFRNAAAVTPKAATPGRFLRLVGI